MVPAFLFGLLGILIEVCRMKFLMCGVMVL